MLDLGRIEAGQIAYESRLISPTEVVNDVVPMILRQEGHQVFE